MRLLSYQSRSNIFILVLFSALNALLWYVCDDDVPKEDVGAYLLGFTILLFLPPSYRNGPKLVATKRFHQIFTVLSSFEILVTLIIPWLLIWNSTNNTEMARYVLAPHLFVFQAQIALETLVTTNAALMFWYTVIANSYRATALVTWIQRSLDVDGQDAGKSIPTRILPTLALLLWFCSNYFIAFVWHPLLPKSKTKPHTGKLKQQIYMG
jgi:hypothetical protein